MHFKKVALLSGLTMLAGSIVVAARSSVNRHTTTVGTLQLAHYNKRHDTDGDGGWNAATTAATLSSAVIGQAWKKCSNSGIYTRSSSRLTEAS